MNHGDAPPVSVAEEDAANLAKALAEESSKSNMPAVKELLDANQRIHCVDGAWHDRGYFAENVLRDEGIRG